MSIITLISHFFLPLVRAQAFPARVVLLRHAEKPLSGPELSEKGWERARALPQIFSQHPELNKFGFAVAVYGMSPSREGRSVRSIQTVSPLAESLGLEVRADFQGDDYRQLVREISNHRDYAGKLVVVCWRREEIPAIIETFGATPIEKVRSNQYDTLWMLTPTADGHIDLQTLRQSI